MQQQSVQSDDLVYCCETECKQLIKIITSAIQHYKDHNGHKTQVTSVLRAELLEKDNNKNPLEIPTINNKEDIMTLIDNEISSLNKLFQQTMLDLSKKLKTFVDDNLVPLKTIQLLFKAVLDANREDIIQYQSELLYLKKDFDYFEEQEYFAKDVDQQLKKIFVSSKDQILEFNQIALMKPTAKLSPLINPDANQIPKWSTVNKHQSIQVNGQSVNFSSFFTSVLIDTLLTFQQNKTISLKITKMSEKQCAIQIIDLNLVKVKCPNLVTIEEKGNGAYSHFDDGGNYSKPIPEIWATDTYGQGEEMSFEFTTGDIIDLIWNGPLKTFTTLKKSTGEKYSFNFMNTYPRFDFKVQFSAESQIYFGVSMNNDCSIEIV